MESGEIVVANYAVDGREWLSGDEMKIFVLDEDWVKNGEWKPKKQRDEGKWLSCHEMNAFMAGPDDSTINQKEKQAPSLPASAPAPALPPDAALRSPVSRPPRRQVQGGPPRPPSSTEARAPPPNQPGDALEEIQKRLKGFKESREKEVRRQRLALKKAVMQAFNKLSTNGAKVRQVSHQLAEAMGNAAHNELHQLYLMDIITERLLAEASSDTFDTDSAFPLADVTVSLCSQFPDLLRLIRSCFDRETWLLSSKCLQIKQKENLISLYSAIMQAKLPEEEAKNRRVRRASDSFGIEAAWKWLASYLNRLPPKPPLYTAKILLAFLQIAGHELSCQLQNKFKASMSVIEDSIIPKLDPDPRVEAATYTLKKMVKEFHSSGFRIPPHDGKRKLEQTPCLQERKIVVTSPDDSTVCSPGKALYVAWSHANLTSPDVTVYLCKGDALVQTLSEATDASTGFFYATMDMTLAEGEDYRVAVYDYGGSGTYGLSPTFRAIKNVGIITVLSPDGSEVHGPGEGLFVTWVHDNLVCADVAVYLYKGIYAVQALAETTHAAFGFVYTALDEALCAGEDYWVMVCERAPTGHLGETYGASAYFAIGPNPAFR